MFNISESTEFVFAVSPVFFDFNEEFEEHFFAEESFDVVPSVAADAFQHSAVSSDDDSFLAVALDLDNRHDVDRIRLFVVFFDDNFGCVRHLFVVSE